MNNRSYHIEDRLIDFAVEIIRFAGALPKTTVGNHMGGQLLRSGTAPSLNDGEAKSAESKKDFLHKMKICLKELRESYNNLRILQKAGIGKLEHSSSLISECNELISIFVKSILTASKTSQ